MRLALLALTALATLGAQPYTRGVGVYPGDPKQDFAPTLVPDAQTYRNIALHRPAYQSSSYDYNLTAQLVTDGIKETSLPRWVSVSTSQGPLKKQEREHLLDHNITTTADLAGSRVWVQVEPAGGDAPPEVDRVEVWARVSTNAQLPAGWTLVASGSDDGQDWKELGRAAGTDRPSAPPPGAPTTPYGPRLADFAPSVPFTAPARHRFYRVEFEAPSATRWSVGEIVLLDKGQRFEAGGPYHFTSAWKSAGSGEEWVYVDLGAPCTFDRVVLTWIRRAAEGVDPGFRRCRQLETLAAAARAGGAIDD